LQRVSFWIAPSTPALLEEATACQNIQEHLPLQPGDVPDTWADVSDLERGIHDQPNTSLKDGVARFMSWYRSCDGV
jgi:UDP-glucuronate 4-epimerase